MTSMSESYRMSLKFLNSCVLAPPRYPSMSCYTQFSACALLLHKQSMALGDASWRVAVVPPSMSRVAGAGWKPLLARKTCSAVMQVTSPCAFFLPGPRNQLALHLMWPYVLHAHPMQ